MAIASLKLWLDDPNRKYIHGLLLYEQYGDNPVILALLKSGQGSYQTGKLINALQALNERNDLVPKKIIIGEYIPEPTTIHGKEDFDYPNTPELIIQIRDKKNSDYAQARKLHESIRVIDDQQYRLEAALELLDKMDAVDTSWSVLDLYRETGEVKKLNNPDQQSEVDTLTLTELMREDKNLQSNISKDKGRLLEAKDDKRKLIISQRLDQRKQRLEMVRLKQADLLNSFNK
ncbi:hypothetical protein [Pedobacter antarcticus]|uniref:hypothetical protein n=1 Tax=Pedobacter antarcticus TaxID=34086 RepID=UPI00088CAA00|nr:hypothetical protein [Pedobacter antarcticus]SDM40500.1 hypothetical protein SAMN04488084_106168 [Pedobacter antarcticus]